MSDAPPAPFTTPEMADAFSARAHVRQMLRFERALARAEAGVGVIPQPAAAAIAAACDRALHDAPLDADAIARDAAASGTPAIPLLRLLGERLDDDARRWLHWGATSQDAVDTALALQMRDGLALLDAELAALGDVCAALAERHRATVMAGRTLLQQAVPITFGLKAARWLALAARQRRALAHAREHSLAIQLGGAAGTLAALGDRGLEVAERLGEELALPVPDLPWHAERDRVATVALALGVVAGAMGKIAGDVALLAQTEVGEVAEGAAPGTGGSSAMPQKRNPVDAVAAVAAARLAVGVAPTLLASMAQEHERAAGAWQAEPPALAALFGWTAGAVSHARRALDGLEVDAARMRANLDLAGGAVMAESLATALAARVGRPEAQRLVAAAVARARGEGTALRDAARGDAALGAHLGSDEIDGALDPARYLGAADALIDRALAAWRDVPPPARLG
jgi:3-carboxy-cis,cis-muconate cycloisomerase